MADEQPDEETHALMLPDVPITMPPGELPLVRPDTIGGIPAYEADTPPPIVEKPKPKPKKKMPLKKKARR